MNYWMPSKIENAAVIRGLRAVARAQQRLDGNDLPAAAEEITYEFKKQAITPTRTASLAPRVFSSSLSGALTLSNLDQEKREFSTAGLGDRTQVLSNVPTSTQAQIFPLKESYDTPTLIDTDYQPTHSDLLLLRDSVTTYAAREVKLDPEISQSDLRAAVDSVFGDGVGDLLGVRLESSGGKTDLKVDQASQISWAHETDREVLVTAIAKANESFQRARPEFGLVGSDVDAQVQALGSALGLEGSVVVAQVKESLAKGTGLDAALSDLKNFVQDFQMGDRGKQVVEAFTTFVSDTKAAVASAFSKNPILDDMRFRYTSNRYGNAFSSDEIDTVAAITANTDFLER